MPAKLLIAALFLFFSTNFLSASDNNVCPRPPIGRTVTDPVDINGSNGVLKVELEYHTSTDEQGRPRYCFLTKDGNLAPNLRLHPGDELILTLKNDLPPVATIPQTTSIHTMHESCTGGTLNASATNLHFHGLVIAPVCQQDDTLNT